MTIRSEAQEWLDAMVANLAEAELPALDRRRAVAIVEEYIDAFAVESPNPDAYRNALLSAIGDSQGVVLFVSPDTGERTITTGTALMQMLQTRSLLDALDATDGVVVY